MPELPEVETTRRGIEPHLIGHTLCEVFVHEPRLRWPIAEDLPQRLRGHPVQAVRRRAKYLLLDFPHGTLLIHLGMSGSLRLVEAGSALKKHDHVEFRLDTGLALRLHDPRRFGALLWTGGNPKLHPLLARLGPEPLGEEFDGEYLYQALQRRKQAIKTAIMDNHVVVGVGNIYANEALFLAGIDPRLSCRQLSLPRTEKLAACIRAVLSEALTQGGSTLRDFLHPQGRPGYFQQTLKVYGREGQPCPICATPIVRTLIGQRASFYCPCCQH